MLVLGWFPCLCIDDGEYHTLHPRIPVHPSPTTGSPGEPKLPSGAKAAVLWYNMGVTRQKEQDGKGAVECYSRAAAEGHAKAQHNLAAIFEKGVPGVPKDEQEAVRLFQLAADQGLAESCYSLAMHLKFGLGERHLFDFWSIDWFWACSRTPA